MKIIYVFLLLFIPIVLGYYFFMQVFGCSLSMGHDFTCRIIKPVFGWATSFSFLFCIILIIIYFYKPTDLASIKTKKFLKLIFVFLFVLSVLIPLVLVGIVSSIPPSEYLAKLEGYTPSACAEGKSAVPWGASFSSDACYSKLDMCDKISKESILKKSCYITSDGKLRPNKISSFDGCKTIGDPYSIVICEQQFAAKTGDWKYCESITDKNELNAITHRHQCFETVTGVEIKDVLSEDKGIEMQSYAIENENNINACEIFNGLKKDVCLFWMMEYSDNGKIFCDSIETSQIYKNDCRRFYELNYN